MTPRPVVTVAMASFNAAAFIEKSLQSALSQSLAQLEIIVVDDASRDDTAERVAALAAQDPRVRLEIMPENRGPAAARNRAIDLARGEWLAVVDADDLMHPDRLRRLLEIAEGDGADMVADDLLSFDDAPPFGSARFLKGARARGRTWVPLDAYLRETALFSPYPNLGYLKPLIRLDRLRAAGVRYDESLRIAEDDDLIVRLLAAGLSYRLDPFPGYLYRRHSGSTSHRLSIEALDRMLATHERTRAAVAQAGPAAARALEARRRAMLDARAFTETVQALKRRDAFGALAVAAGRPQAMALFRLVASGRAGRLLKRLRTGGGAHGGGAPGVCVVSSRAPDDPALLQLAARARQAGLEPHLVQPSPNAPGARGQRPGRPAFASVHARRPIGTPPQEEAVGRPDSSWEAEELAYLARHAPLRADVIVADGRQAGEALAYVLRPDSPAAVLSADAPAAQALRRALPGAAVFEAGSEAFAAWLAQARARP